MVVVTTNSKKSSDDIVGLKDRRPDLRWLLKI